MSSSTRKASGSTVPFTPRPARKTSSRYTLSEKEITQIAGTLASVRKVRPDAIVEELDISGDAVAHLKRQLNGHATRTVSRGMSSKPISEHRSRTHVPEASSSRQPVASSSRSTMQTSSAQRSHTSRNEKAPDRRPEREIEVDVRVENRVVDLDDEDGEIAESLPERMLDGLPLEVQEAWICEDLLFALQSVEGQLIRHDSSYDPLDEQQRLAGARWRVDPSLDSSLLSLVQRLLPLASAFTSVEASMELRANPEYGMVSHALCSGIRQMLKEYRVLVAQLESLFLQSSTFTLQTLYFHLHPTIHTMTLLSSLCQALETEDSPLDTSDATDDDDDGLGGMAEELLGGAGLKGLMKNLRAQDGVTVAGPVLGGEVLGIVSERDTTMSGDPTAATLHSTLLLHAAQPYCKMLIRWVTTGHLSDPFEEFMVKESGHITKGVLESDYTDEYWERRYTLRDGSSITSKVAVGKSPAISAGVPSPRSGTTRLPGGACIPAFLQPWKHKILLAGKYLNVIRECGIEVKRPGEVKEEDMVVINEARFYKQVEDAYIHANQTLLKLMVEEQELIPHLRSMKHWFFLDQSDFLTNFLDLAAPELRKKAKDASIVKLQSLLDLAVRNPSSSSSNDPYKDDLKVTVQSQGLYDWLMKIVSRTGNVNDDGELEFVPDEKEEEVKKGEREKTLLAIDALAFDYSVKFPLSLVISRKTITRYQLIFRFLLHLHYLESALSSMWLEHKSPQWRTNCGHEDTERWKLRVFSLRDRMLAFVRQILAFATGEVLEPNWRSLEGKLAKVQTVDQLLRDHVDFLDTCLKQCMLTTAKLLGVYAKLMNTMSTFAFYSASLSDSLNKFLSNPADDPVAIAARWTVLQKFEVNFNHHTKLHLDAVTYNAGSENVALLALVTRLHQTTLQT